MERKLQVGDRVIIASTSQYAGGSKTGSNPKDTEGVITHIGLHGEGTVMVDWSNGKSNAYALTDLVLSTINSMAKYKIGGNTSGHRFEIGQEVVLLERDVEHRGIHKMKDANSETWWMVDEVDLIIPK